MQHNRLDDNNFKEKFEKELDLFDKLTSGKSKGFRAPTFSLNKNTSWAIDHLIEKKYLYDSSIVPAKTKLYGFNDADVAPYNISSDFLMGDNKSSLIEFPLLITKVFGKKFQPVEDFF